MSVTDTYRFISRHPLTQNRKTAALARWIRWQITSRLSSHAAAVPFVNQTRLLTRRGMTGATGNLYCGLHEFEDMAFVLHFLRPGDGFVDVGANIGAYTVLATLAGARTLSFEPVPSSFQALLDNVHLNRMEHQVDTRCEAVGAASGQMRITVDADTTNRVLTADERYGGSVVNVPQVALDQALMNAPAPKLIKIDVEGYEMQVLQGASKVLAHPGVEALIIELNGCGGRYGVEDDDVHSHLGALGFVPYSYAPRGRTLASRGGIHSTQGNTLYLRNGALAQQRLSTAPAFNVLGQSL